MLRLKILIYLMRKANFEKQIEKNECRIEYIFFMLLSTKNNKMQEMNKLSLLKINNVKKWTNNQKKL